MKKHGKRYQKAVDEIATTEALPLLEAVEKVIKAASARFDESVDVAIRLGIDARKAEQQLRGTVSLPHGTGKSVRIIVFAAGDKAKEAEAAGANKVGGPELVEEVQKGFMDFDVAIATPDLTKDVSKLGRLLGPRGLMPNPKVGTVTFEVAHAVKECKAGRSEYRNDKIGNYPHGSRKDIIPSE